LDHTGRLLEESMAPTVMASVAEAGDTSLALICGSSLARVTKKPRRRAYRDAVDAIAGSDDGDHAVDKCCIDHAVERCHDASL
jgi:hypothetical protein